MKAQRVHSKFPPFFFDTKWLYLLPQCLIYKSLTEQPFTPTSDSDFLGLSCRSGNNVYDTNVNERTFSMCHWPFCAGRSRETSLELLLFSWKLFISRWHWLDGASLDQDFLFSAPAFARKVFQLNALLSSAVGYFDEMELEIVVFLVFTLPTPLGGGWQIPEGDVMMPAMAQREYLNYLPKKKRKNYLNYLVCLAAETDEEEF